MDEFWDRLVAQPVAVLATIGDDGRPHLVPFTFGESAPRQLVSAVDAKPKSTRRLQRLENIERDPRVTVLAHEYDSDWTRLWWVRAEGQAEVVDSPPPGAHRLFDRYPQYLDQTLGPWIVIDVENVAGWSADG
ncbi:TIGR03668 family PPOX class F420-dependent oxidoreductase [soil metagenome]